MFPKIVILAVLVAIATAQSGGYGHEHHHVVDYYSPPHYQFHYGVEDAHTGDKKQHHETREGDVTHGEYSLVEPDGTTRTVKYSVDKHSGFNAEVHRSGHAQHPTHQVHHAPVAVHHVPVAIHHAPIAVHHAPVHHSSGHGHATSFSSVSHHVEHGHHH